ncbi:hypothetical protein KIL84_013437 [Mauremys mutica]|uniref:Uncharacterized protein n=1 Tax=Mauremys mutica TaxID=74926 RepID=A0A9D3WVI4_9SAUR|nr:hypothetical protein KIL84_013437 [Mauremys mutica]
MCVSETMEMLRGNMDSFTTTARTLEFVLAPRAFDHLQRKWYINDTSLEEEEGGAEGSPFAQLLMDMQECETQALVRKTNKHDSLSSSTPQRRKEQCQNGIGNGAITDCHGQSTS